MYQEQKPFTTATDVFIWWSQQITWSQKQYPMIASYSSNWLYVAFSVEDYNGQSLHQNSEVYHFQTSQMRSVSFILEVAGGNCVVYELLDWFSPW